MPITNLNNTHLSAAQTAAKDAVTALENALATINVFLKPDDQ